MSSPETFYTQTSNPEFPGAMEGLVAPAVAGAEHGKYDGYALAEMRATLDPVHIQTDRERAQGLDPLFNERTPEEQALLETVAHVGSAVVNATRPDTHSTIESVNTNESLLDERIERAISTTEFIRTPELEKAVSGFYRDHDKLKATILKVVDQTLTDESREAILSGHDKTGNFAIDTVLKEIVRPAGDTPSSRRTQLQRADEAITRTYLREVCVGATTLEEEDVQVIEQLHASVKAAANHEGLLFYSEQTGKDYWRQIGNDEDLIIMGLRRELASPQEIKSEKADRLTLERTTHEDMRKAGQLLFHNTPYLSEVVLHPFGEGNFRLVSRTAQVAISGNYKNGTLRGGIEHHSNLTHWSERYMPLNYKESNDKRDDLTYTPGTVAVPIAELVKQLPYSARDIEYGVLESKPGVVPEVTVNDGSNFGENSGSFDIPGEWGEDRVFLASYKGTEQREAHNTSLDFGKEMSTESGNVSSILLTQADLRKYDGHLYPFGMGEGFPGTLHVPYDPYIHLRDRSMTTEALQAVRAQQEADTTKFIKQLQLSSIENPRYARRYVVPLRSGIMEFRVEGMHSGTALSKQSNYANKVR